MGSIEENSILAELSEDVDTSLIKWMSEYKVAPLNIIAIILARLTWLAKQSDCKDDYLSLLEAPKQILDSEEKEKQLH
jgi:hypothetical protein